MPTISFSDCVLQWRLLGNSRSYTQPREENINVNNRAVKRAAVVVRGLLSEALRDDWLKRNPDQKLIDWSGERSGVVRRSRKQRGSAN
ncbi:hypothetical protein ILYODFUR_023160 [Ilyodon furcidens]|uniref:Uncharacterized protein n=1 Tax=Ilyodon furcidens TaxID=33524 RepID=A0ABV0T0I0_9TELE